MVSLAHIYSNNENAKQLNSARINARNKEEVQKEKLTHDSREQKQRAGAAKPAAHQWPGIMGNLNLTNR